MLEFYKNSFEVVQGSEVLWKENLFNPIMLENIDKWKNELSIEEIQLIEFLLSKEMKMFGYENIKIDPTYGLKKHFYKFLLKIFVYVYSVKLN